MADENNAKDMAYSAITTEDITLMAVAARSLASNFDATNATLDTMAERLNKASYAAKVAAAEAADTELKQQKVKTEKAKTEEAEARKQNVLAKTETEVAKKKNEELRAEKTRLDIKDKRIKMADNKEKKALAAKQDEEKRQKAEEAAAEKRQKAAKTAKQEEKRQKTQPLDEYALSKLSYAELEKQLSKLMRSALSVFDHFSKNKKTKLIKNYMQTGELPSYVKLSPENAAKLNKYRSYLGEYNRRVNDPSIRAEILEKDQKISSLFDSAAEKQRKAEEDTAEKQRKEEEKTITEREKALQEEQKIHRAINADEEDKRKTKLQDMLSRADSLSTEELNSLSDEDRQELLSMAYAKNANSRESLLQHEQSMRRGIAKEQERTTLKGAYKQSMTSGSLGPLKNFLTSTLLAKAGPWTMLIAVLVKFAQTIKKVGEQFKQTFDKSQKSLSALGQTSNNLNIALGRSQHDIASANAKLNTFKVGAAAVWNTLAGTLLKFADALGELIPAIKETEKVYAGINRRAAIADAQTELIGHGMSYGNSFTTASNIDAAVTAYLMKAYGISATEARNHSDYQQAYSDMTNLVTSGGQSGMFNTANWQAYGYTNGLYIPGVQYTDAYLDTLRSQMLATELSIYQEGGAEGLAEWNNKLGKIQTLVGNMSNSLYSFDEVEQISATYLEDLNTSVQDLGTLEEQLSNDNTDNRDHNFVAIAEEFDNTNNTIENAAETVATAIGEAADLSVAGTEDVLAVATDSVVAETQTAAQAVAAANNEAAQAVANETQNASDAIVSAINNKEFTAQSSTVYMGNSSTAGATSKSGATAGAAAASTADKQTTKVSDGSTIGAPALDFTAVWDAYEDLAAYINRTSVYSGDYYRKDYLGQLKTGIQALSSQEQIDYVAKELVEEKTRLKDFAKNGQIEAIAEGFNGQNLPVWMQAVLGAGATASGFLGLSGAGSAALSALASKGIAGSAAANALGVGSGVWSTGNLLARLMEIIEHPSVALGGSYATGGIGTSPVTNATLFENGPEAVIPLTSDLGKTFMADAITKAFGSESNTLSQDQITINIDGPTFLQDERAMNKLATEIGDRYAQVKARRGGI